MRGCTKKTGPGDSSLIAMAVRNNSGDSAINPTAAPKKSMTRLRVSR